MVDDMDVQRGTGNAPDATTPSASTDPTDPTADDSSIFIFLGFCDDILYI